MIPNSLRIQRKQTFFFMFMDLKICYLILHLFSSSFSYWKPHRTGGPWLFISKSWGIHKADWNLKSYVWAVYQRRALLLANPVGLLCWRSSDVIFRSFLLAWSDSLDKSPAISCPQYGNLSPKGCWTRYGKRVKLRSQYSLCTLPLTVPILVSFLVFNCF